MSTLATPLVSLLAPVLPAPVAAWAGAPCLASAGGFIDHVLPHEIPGLRFGGFSVTNTLFMLVASSVLMLIVFPRIARKGGGVPTGSRNLFETILEFLREQVVRPSLHEATDRFMPLLWTMFFLILFANLLGALPIAAVLTLVTGKETAWGGTATGDISITLALALCSFFAIHIAGIRSNGFAKYAKSFAPHVPWPLLILLVPLEILAAFVKPFALCIRLFANMIAGHIVLAILLSFTGILAAGLTGMSAGVSVASVLGAVVIGLLEIFVAFLQAYIFTFLTTLFLGMAVHPEH